MMLAEASVRAGQTAGSLGGQATPADIHLSKRRRICAIAGVPQLAFCLYARGEDLTTWHKMSMFPE